MKHLNKKDTLSSVDFSVGENHFKQGRTTCICTYCGDNTANDRDHLTPASWLGKRDYNDEWVLSCRDCNLRLGDAPVFTVEERAEYVLNSIMRSRHCTNLIKTPNWSDDELIELDYSLREKVKASIEQSKLLKLRIKRLQEVADVYILHSQVTDERTARAIIYEFAHTRGRRSFVVSQLSCKYGLSEDKVIEIINSDDFSKFWIAMKCFYGFDYSISNHKLRTRIAK